MTGYRMTVPAATGVSTRKDGDWRAEARCVGVDPELFFPPAHNRESEAAAKLICRGCAVQDQCLDAALDSERREEKSFGVHGGLSGRERRIIINKRKQADVGNVLLGALDHQCPVCGAEPGAGCRQTSRSGEVLRAVKPDPHTKRQRLAA